MSDIEYERELFKLTPETHTLIDVKTGTVFSSDAVVMEEPGDDIAHFYEMPQDYIADKPFIITVASLDGYENPVVVERDTELIVDARTVWAVDHGSQIIDFERILSSDEAARETARTLGFKLWD